jgi:protein N-terminal methyltransferase
VDLVEPVRHFLEKAQVDLGGITEGNRAVNFFCTPLQVGFLFIYAIINKDICYHTLLSELCYPLAEPHYFLMQEFTPEAGRYDVIWVQWCIGHLTDHDFIEFFKRALVSTPLQKPSIQCLL